MIAEHFLLKSRPQAKPHLDNFILASTEIPALQNGEVLVRNTAMQLTAVMAELLRGEELPMPPYSIGEPLWGPAVGTVVESRAADFAPGDTVQSMNGWRSAFIAQSAELSLIPEGLFARPEMLLCQGPTAYHGIVDIARVGAGDTVFVSGAAGGVGSLAGQIARCRGAAKVVGSAGSKEKCRWLVEELGFDAALNYRDEDFAEQLRAEFPDGFSVFFDTVGGTQFEFAVQTAAPAARFALCGTLAQQFAAAPGASMPRFEALTAIRKQLVILPFSTFHTPEQITHWVTHYAAWLAEDRFVFPQSSPAGGLREAPQALIDLGKGKFRGNVVLALD